MAQQPSFFENFFPGQLPLPWNVLPSQPQYVRRSFVHGGLGLHVHALSQPISPAQISPFAQSSLDVHVFPALPASPPSGSADVAPGAGSAVGVGSGVGAGSADVAVVAGSTAVADGSEVGGTGGEVGPHAIATALAEARKRNAAATWLLVRFMREGNREAGPTSTVHLAPAPCDLPGARSGIRSRRGTAARGSGRTGRRADVPRG